MKLKFPIKYKKCKYNNITELSNDVNIPFKTLYYRLSTGWDLDRACTQPVGHDPVIVENNQFASLSKACKFYEVAFGTVRSRLSRGWSLEQALELIIRPGNPVCKGLLYCIKNKINNKKYFGITTRSLKMRMKEHEWKVKTGSNTKLHKAMRNHGFENFKIKLLKNADNREDLRKLEIKYIKKYNSIRQGYNTAKGGCHLGERFGKSLTYKGIKFNSVKALSDYLGLNEGLVHYRLNNNLNLEDISLRQKWTNFEHYGVVYKNTQEAADKFGLTKNRVVKRVQANIPFDKPLKGS